MTRRAAMPRARQDADVDRFTRDLFGESTLAEAHAPSSTRPFDLFDEIGRAQPYRPLPRVMRSRSSISSPFPPVIPAEYWEAPATAPAPPFPTNCTTISVFRRVLLEAETAAAVTAATPTTPPVNRITTTAVPLIADFDARLPKTRQPAGTPDTFFEANAGRALLVTNHLRVDPADATRFQVRVKGQLCHPADAKDKTKLPEGKDRLPIVILIHGNHEAVVFNLVDTGGARRTVVTLSGNTLTFIPARATGVTFEVPNHLGYTNLQEHLATQGIVSVSIDTNAANELNSLMAFRGELGLAMLDHLRELDKDAKSPLHRRLDFTRVGIIGHSRGGDAVAILAAKNSRRKVKERYGIRSVVQIAPTDFTGMTNAALRMNTPVTDSYLVVYGSHDGDVSGAFDPAELSQAWGFGGTGFRHYDRSGTQRAMVFIHGATHNRFNSVWIDPARNPPGGARDLASKQADNDVDARTVDPALPAAASDPPGPGKRDRRVLSAAAHRTLMREYIGGWLFKQLLGATGSAALFNGTATNSLGTPVSLQWKHGPRVRTIDFFDDANPRRSDVGGASTAPPFVKERLIELSQLPNIPHHDQVLRADAPTGALRVYTTTVPAGKRDLSKLTHLTFRMSKVFPDISTPAKITGTAFPATIDVALFDGTNRVSVDAATIATLNPRAVLPYHRTIGSLNLTKVEMQTFAVPLAKFTSGGSPVNLSKVQAIEITFNATAGQEIHLDTLAFVAL